MEYEPEVAIEMNAVETPDEWIERGNWQSNLRSGTDPPKYFGSTVAGQAEFPWTVDVRNLNDPVRGNWATGNLISDLWVLTACSIVKNWEKYSSEKEILKFFQAYAILFCTNYVWEDYTRYDEHNEELYRLTQGHDDVGARTIKSVVKHPQCDTMRRTNNFLLLKVNNHIPIYVPVIGYMPLFGAPISNSGKFINFKGDVLPALEGTDGTSGKKLVCYVASFGRIYNNVPRPGNENYKVKYRAYYSDYEYCTDTHRIYEALCRNNGNNPRSSADASVVNVQCVDGLTFEGLSWRQFMCFRTYAKHGAVCDHDHGAPLVCNGEVYGFVARAVPPDYCVNNRMFPFIVVKINKLQASILYPQPPQIPEFGPGHN